MRWRIGSFASEVGFRFRVFRYWIMDRSILSLSVIVLNRVGLTYHMSQLETPQPIPSSFLQTAIKWWCYRAHRDSQGEHLHTHHAWAYPAALQEAEQFYPVSRDVVGKQSTAWQSMERQAGYCRWDSVRSHGYWALRSLPLRR